MKRTVAAMAFFAALLGGTLPARAVEQTAASTLEGFAVQLGSFSSRDNANRFAGELSGEGYEAFVMEGTSNNKRVYRVRVGPRPTRAAAERLAGTLSQAGHQGMVVTLPANAAARN